MKGWGRGMAVGCGRRDGGGGMDGVAAGGGFGSVVDVVAEDGEGGRAEDDMVFWLLGFGCLDFWVLVEDGYLVLIYGALTIFLSSGCMCVYCGFDGGVLAGCGERWNCPPSDPLN